MEDHSQIKTTDIQPLKPWSNPSLTHWEVEESLELNPLKFLADLNQTLGS